MKSWHIILLLIGLAIGFFAGLHVRNASTKSAEFRSDTLVIVDTVRDSVPVPVRETVTKYIQLPADTIVRYIKGDTLFLPITQKIYVTDNYRAWVSGYNTTLDSINVFPKTFYVTKKQSVRRWGLGVTGGYGIGQSGLSPYIGVGLYYRIW